MALQIITKKIGSAYTGQLVDLTLVALGGTAPYTWSKTNGTLPTNLVLDPVTGNLSGTTVDSEIGTYSGTIRVTDSATATYDLSYIFEVKPGKFSTTHDWLLDVIYRLIGNSYPVEDYYKSDIITKLFHYGISGSSPGLLPGSTILVENWTEYFPHVAPSTVPLATVLTGLSTPFGVNVQLDTTNFTTNLSPADNTVQKAMDTIDNFTLGGGGAAGITPFTALVDGIGSGATEYITLKAATDAGHRSILVKNTIVETANNPVSGSNPLFLQGVRGAHIDFSGYSLGVAPLSKVTSLSMQANITIGNPTIYCTSFGFDGVIFDDATFVVSNTSSLATMEYFLDNSTGGMRVLNSQLTYLADAGNVGLIALQTAHSKVCGLEISALSSSANLTAIIISGGYTVVDNIMAWNITSSTALVCSGFGATTIVSNINGLSLFLYSTGGVTISNVKESVLTLFGSVIGVQITNCSFTQVIDSTSGSAAWLHFNDVFITSCTGLSGVGHTLNNFEITSNGTQDFVLGGDSFDQTGQHNLTNIRFSSEIGFRFRLSSHCNQVSNIRTYSGFHVDQNVYDSQVTNAKIGMNGIDTLSVGAGAIRTVLVAIKTTTGTITDNASVGQTQIICITSMDCNAGGPPPSA